MTDSIYRPADRTPAGAGVADASPAPIFVIQDRRLRYANRAFAALTGRELPDLVGRASLEAIHADDRFHLLERGHEQQQGKLGVYRTQFRLCRPDGGETWVYATTAPFEYEGRPAVVGTVIEVSERRQAQEAVAKSQRLDAIGRLAGGMAHDFNNLLQVVLGHAERLVTALAHDRGLQKSAMEIRNSAARAAELTDRMLSLGQRQVLEPQLIDLPRLITDLRPSIERRVGPSVKLVLRRGRHAAQVRADRNRLIHVLAYLVDNARDAMPGGGDLSISTEQVDVDDAMRLERPWLRTGTFMRLQVEDTGLGMDSRTAAHAFEPFFTTKPKGAGTGLGLATVYGLVKQSNGYVWVESTPSVGTRVVVLLPAEVPVNAMGEARPPDVPRAAQPERPRILMVEDEGSVRELVAAGLERNGFEVVTAASAEEALPLASRGFQILLTDISLPGMSGAQLARQLRRGLPALRILLMSGYPREEFLSASEDLPFIAKPFTTRALVERLRGLLEPAERESLRA